MKQDKFLIFIMVGIGVLILAAVGLFVFRQGQITYVNDNDPSGVVHNYLLAVHKSDFERAYSYLQDNPYKPDLAKFKQAFLSKELLTGNVSTQVGEVTMSGGTAYVTLTILRSSGGPILENYRENNSAALIKQNGQWKISSMPYPYWMYDWYQVPSEKTKP